MSARAVLAAGAMVLAAASPAAAHETAGALGGFANGFMHPLLGPDHVVAMVAVGLWGAPFSAPRRSGFCRSSSPW
jgi:urease accessory protein